MRRFAFKSLWMFLGGVGIEPELGDRPPPISFSFYVFRGGLVLGRLR